MQTFSWIPVSAKLPEKSVPANLEYLQEVSEEFLVSLKDGEVSLDRYNFKYETWVRFPKSVTHWSQKPRPADLENDR